ncbi:MAG: SusC/RagA family TonB-linked outer membrane protein [Bacteroidales bacterium]|nr:SusC/RagA family TonB-linked outer membrane protein [Bacteroidales bacterium]
MKEKLMMLLACLFLSASVAMAQTSSVKGTVLSAEDGQPVIGASVGVKEVPTIGAITDVNGKFELNNLPSTAKTLVVSYLGMEAQEVAIKSVVTVKLEASALDLEEVVHVAYGTQKKSSFTGAAASVDGEKLQKMQVSSISKALEGSTAGLQTASSSGTPGSNASIIIRGIGSISASQSPLIVLDGVPYEGSLNSIPAQDIQSLTVLKDAAANSMYGARGSNGVIIVTTRQAAAGEAQVSFDGRYGYNQRGVPAYDVISDHADYYEMMFEAIANSLYESDPFYAGASYQDARGEAAENLISGYLKYNIYEGIADNRIVNPVTGKVYDNVRSASKKWNDSWATDPFTPGARQEYNLNISGGTQNTRAYASLSYLDDKGYVENSGFTRIAARAKVDQRVSDAVKAGINLSYSNTAQRTFGDTGGNYSNIFMFSQQIAPIYPIYLYDNDGNLMKNAEGNPLFDFGTQYKRPYAQEQNPLAVLKDNINSLTSDNVSSRGYIDINLAKSLKFSTNIAYDVFNQNSNTYATPNGGDAANVGGRGYKEFQRYAALNANQLLTWSPEFGKSSIVWLLGHETKHDESQYMFGHMTNFLNAYNSEFANATMYQELTSNTSEYALEGYFTRFEYDFDDKYYVSASYRRDASSRFAPDVRWGDFWSVGASWRINQEAFLKDVAAIDNLKLKASYGTQGNDNVGYDVVYMDLYRVDRVNGEPALTKVFRGNPDLTWEKSNNFNAGIEIGLFNRLDINADYFVKETKDMLYSRPLAPSLGKPASMLVNDIDMKNTGVELEVALDLIKTRNINWNVAFNATHYKNELTKLPSDKDPKGYQSGSYWRKIGGSLYDFYTYEWAGVDPVDGKPMYNKYTEIMDADGNGTGEYIVTQVNKTSEATLRETGKSAIPDLYGGLNSAFSAFGFDLSVATAFQVGGYVWDSFYQNLMNPGDVGSNMHKDMYQRWNPSNTETSVPRLCYQDQDANDSSDRWLTSASYFSLRNVTLGYTLPSNLTKKLSIQNARVYMSGDNLWLKSARKGLDPRQSFSGSTGYVYSALATYSVGVNLTF